MSTAPPSIGLRFRAPELFCALGVRLLHRVFVISVLDWNQLATEANAETLLKCKLH